jgi:hypothetical protein
MPGHSDSRICSMPLAIFDWRTFCCFTLGAEVTADMGLRDFSASNADGFGEVAGATAVTAGAGGVGAACTFLRGFAVVVGMSFTFAFRCREFGKKPLTIKGLRFFNWFASHRHGRELKPLDVSVYRQLIF